MNNIEATRVLDKNIKYAKNLTRWQQCEEEIEMMDLCKLALEKQILKKPQEVDVDFSTFVCPNCLSTIMYTDEKETHNYCLKCGQRLDWGVEE